MTKLILILTLIFCAYIWFNLSQSSQEDIWYQTKAIPDRVSMVVDTIQSRF